MPVPDQTTEPDPKMAEQFREFFDKPQAAYDSERLAALEVKVDRILDLLEGRRVAVPALGHGTLLDCMHPTLDALDRRPW